MLKLFLADLKMMVRGRQALFWSLAFPLMFTVIFGFFFGSGNVGAGGTIALINNSDSQIAVNMEKAFDSTNVFKIKKETDVNTAKEELSKSQIGAIVEIPQNFGNLSDPTSSKEVTIIDDPANAQVNSAVSGFINQFLTQTDYQIQKIKPLFTINEEKTNTRELTYFDFVLMGLIGLALMNASIQGIAITMANYREDKILKRITTTPLPSWKFVSAEVLSRLVLNVVQVSLILAIGVYGFHAHIYGSLLLIYLFA
jgi:ABC-2 type transport system permease protein